MQLYRASDQLSGALVLALVVFSPWAFGSTEKWSVWVMNCGGFALGLLLLLKLGVRTVRGYRPPKWESPTAGSGARFVTAILVLLTLLLLAYCFIGALNTRATFDERSLTFQYHNCLRWLPHSFDSAATWFASWSYLGLACSFWALRDWLTGKSSPEERADWVSTFSDHSTRKSEHGTRNAEHATQPALTPPLPARLRLLLWVLALNGALLGLEAILQRSANSPRLLFLVQPRIHQTADGQFGPYAYRSNAAQYFNLLWPVTLGFWWTLNRGRRTEARDAKQQLLLAATGIMGACPIISTSRAGAIISVTMAGCAALVFGFTRLSTQSIRSPRLSAALHRSARPLLAFFLGSLALGFAFGWKQLQPRLRQLDDGFAGREQIYDVARPIAHDYPWFGTGPGSFETVSQLYSRPGIFWPTQLHNDWLETRITFGWVGLALIALTLACVLLRWRVRGGIHGGRRFVILTWLALGGCLLHARFDFPFQIHSILFLFLILCGILFTLSHSSQR